MFELWFYGIDGEFSYRIDTSEFVEYLFRSPRVYGMEWRFDGDGWVTTNDKSFPEAKQTGGFYIVRQ